MRRNTASGSTSSRSTAGGSILATLLIACLPGSAFAVPPAPALFENAPTALSQRTRNGASHVAIVQDRATVSLHRARANAALLATDTQALQLHLEPGIEVQARRFNAYRNPDGTQVWYGRLVEPGRERERPQRTGAAALADRPEASAMLVRDGEQIVGTVRTAGRLYRIRPLNDGSHAIVHVDESRMPATHPTGLHLPPSQPFEPTAAAPDTSEKAPTVIRVMAVFTQSAANASGNPAALVNLAIAETNQGYTATVRSISGWNSRAGTPPPTPAPATAPTWRVFAAPATAISIPITPPALPSRPTSTC